jgi:hypothetical protein
MRQGKPEYGEDDVKILTLLLKQKKAEVNRPLTAQEHEELLKELDRRTGRSL